MTELEGKIQILLNNINQLQEELGKLQPALAEDNLQQKYDQLSSDYQKVLDENAMLKDKLEGTDVLNDTESGD